jgi:PAS domain S-box-containing protein
MLRRPFDDIRTVILLAVLASVIPALALLAGSNHWHRAVIQQQVRATSEQLAETARAEQRSRTTEELFAVLAAADEIRSLDRGRCQKYLARLDAASTRYLQIRIFSTDGARLCGDGQQKGVRSVASEWWFRQALETGSGVYVGDMPDRATGRAMSVFARALTDTRRKPRAVIEIGVRADTGAAPEDVLAATSSTFDGSTALQFAALVVCAVFALVLAWMGATRIAARQGNRQRAMREAELSVRAVADQSLAGVCVVDADGVVFANEALAETLGLAAEQLAGTRDVLDLQGRLSACPEPRRGAEDEAVSYEHRARRADGGAVQLRVSAHRIEHNGRPAILAFALEVARLAGPPTVLLVEDENQVRELLADVLQQAGYRVLAAANGDEAVHLSAAHKGRIDAMLSDVMMPGLNGPAVAERIAPERPEMKVVFMSGYAARDVLAEQSSEHSAFLSKPFSREQLTATLTAVLVEPQAA